MPHFDSAVPQVFNRDRNAPVLRERLPIIVVLDRLRSAFNVGNILRVAEAVRAECVIGCGYTPLPPHPKVARTARGCDALVPCHREPTAAAAVRSLLRNHRHVYAVETTDRSVPYWQAEIRFPAAFVFGNEALGVDPDVLPLCHGLVELPCLGVKNSINVGNCAAVVLYDALRRWRAGQKSSPEVAARAPKPRECTS